MSKLNFHYALLHTIVEMESNELPENALPAGKVQSETYNVFVRRAEVDEEQCVGKVHNGTHNFGSDTREKRINTEAFAVLMLRWNGLSTTTWNFRVKSLLVEPLRQEETFRLEEEPNR